ncbi:hypothetical protein V1527DRAFT_502407, partial [Lipomyces starkeyi]
QSYTSSLFTSSRIVHEVLLNSGISSEIASGLVTEPDSETTMNNTTRASDSALQYLEGDRATLIIAVEVPVSQSYDSMRAAISWSVCALRCRLGLRCVFAKRVAKGGHPGSFMRTWTRQSCGR